MVARLIGKLFVKAMVPLVCMTGVMSYGMYTMGGDPGALFKKIAGGTVQSAKSTVQSAGASLKSLPSKMPTDSPIAKSVGLKKSTTTVYKWVDENGVTQFGSEAPSGVSAESKTYDNNANLMAAQKPVKATVDFDADQIPPGFGADGERLPGMAGMNLPVNADPAMVAKFLQAMQQQQ